MANANENAAREVPVLEVPPPRWSYKLAFLLGGAAFAAISYVFGTVMYKMELSFARKIVPQWSDLVNALSKIPHQHLVTFTPWILGTTGLAILLGYFYDKQVQYRRVAENLAATDSLTMLATRRVLLAGLTRELSRAERNLSNLFSVVMMDIDDFKKYNDTHGHLPGDQLLQDVSAIIRSSLRSSDLAGRFGGEEFVILLSGADEKGAIHNAERLRGMIQTETGVTVSIGVACYPSDGRDIPELIRKADTALYRAKRTGKNKVFPASQLGADDQN